MRLFVFVRTVAPVDLPEEQADLRAMPIAPFLSTLVPVVLGGLLGVAVPIAAVVWPLQYAQGQSIQSIKDDISNIKESLKSLDSKVGNLDERQKQSELDPNKFLGKILGPAAQNTNIGQVLFINDEVVVFPKDSNSINELMKSGYELKVITPTVSGYTIPKDLKAKTDFMK